MVIFQKAASGRSNKTLSCSTTFGFNPSTAPYEASSPPKVAPPAKFDGSRNCHPSPDAGRRLFSGFSFKSAVPAPRFLSFLLSSLVKFQPLVYHDGKVSANRTAPAHVPQRHHRFLSPQCIDALNRLFVCSVPIGILCLTDTHCGLAIFATANTVQKNFDSLLLAQFVRLASCLANVVVFHHKIPYYVMP